MKIDYKEIPTEEIGDLWQLEGVVYGNGEQSIAMLLPFVDEMGKFSDILFPTDEQWQEFLKQTDDPVTPVGKAFVRKATRQVIESVRWKVYERDNYSCRYCGAHGIPMTVDHYVAQKYGGEWTFENLLTACRTCQKKKGHKTVEEWEAYCKLHPELKSF